MTVPVCIIDTETTSLLHDRRIWEIAVIRVDRQADIEIQEQVLQVHDVDLSHADLMSLKIGGFFKRHFASKSYPANCGSQCKMEYEVASAVEYMTRGAHIIGAVPSFDTEALEAMFRRNKLRSTWHYHLGDVENFAIGYLQGLLSTGNHAPLGFPDLKREDLLPPWDSEQIGRWMGVTPATAEERHTALGDARWALRMYNKVMGIDA